MKAKKPKFKRNFSKDELIREVISKVQQIDSWTTDPATTVAALPGIDPVSRPKKSAHTPSVKAKYYDRTARSIKNRLFDSKAKAKDSKLRLSTFVKYLLFIRNAVRKDIGRHNPELPEITKDLCSRYPKYANLIKTLITHKEKRVNKVKTAIINKLVSMDKVDADNLASELTELAKNGRLEHPIINFLRPTTAQLKRLKDMQAANLKERKSNKQTYNIHFINRVIDECLDSDNFNELALGISLSTGRRAVEAVYRGKFEAKGEKEILFSGQVKKGKGVTAKPYPIPTLVDAERIIMAVEKLRNTARYKELSKEVEKLPDEKRNDVLNLRTARMLNYHAKKKLTPNKKVDESPVQYKNSRVIALQMAILKIMPEPKYAHLDINEFVLRYQGHDHYTEFANYQDIAIEDKPEPSKEEQHRVANADVSALQSADDAINNAGSKPLWKLHEKVKELAKETGLPLTQAFIYKGRKVNGEKKGGFSGLPMVKRYMGIPEVHEAINKYNKSI